MSKAAYALQLLILGCFNKERTQARVKSLDNRWKSAVSRLSKADDCTLSSASLRRMSRCKRILGEPDHVQHTCRRHRLCPWCYARHVAQQAYRLYPFLDEDKMLGVQVFSHGVQAVPDEDALAQGAETLRGYARTKHFEAAVVFRGFVYVRDRVVLRSTILGVVHPSYYDEVTCLQEATPGNLRRILQSRLRYPAALLALEGDTLFQLIKLGQQCRTAGWGRVRKTKSEKNCEFCIYQRRAPQDLHVVEEEPDQQRFVL